LREKFSEAKEFASLVSRPGERMGS